MPSIPGMPGDVYYGSADNESLPDWRLTATDDDDAPDPETLSPETIAILGVNPFEDDEADDATEPPPESAKS